MTVHIDRFPSLALPLLFFCAVLAACTPAGSTLPDASIVPSATGGRGAGGARAGGAPASTGGSTISTTADPGSGGSSVGGITGSGGGAGGRSAGGAGASGNDASISGRDGASAGQGGAGSKDAGGRDATPIDGAPLACDDIESAGRLAVYFYDDSAVTGSSIQLHFDVVNYTAFGSRLPQVTVRYWFTDEGAPAANVIEQYYVPIDTTMKFTTLNPPRAGADTVLEMSFRASPDAGVSWIETRGFNFAFHKASYAGTYDQSNDYSYDAKLTKALGPNPKITAYVNGVLAWGCEPPVQPVVIEPPAPSPVVEPDSVDSGR